jgi:hypothetical protein
VISLHLHHMVRVVAFQLVRRETKSCDNGRALEAEDTNSFQTTPLPGSMGFDAEYHYYHTQ